MLDNALVVGAGGFLGAAARYLVGGWVHRALPPSFPWGTLVVNLSGCFGIGLVAGLVEDRLVLGPAARLFWMVGVLGGYTTFSSFAYETFALARDGSLLLAAANAGGQVALGLLAVWAGLATARGLA